MKLRAPTQTTPEPCGASLVVLDFDGTLTDADAHAPAFHDASRRALARRLGWDEARTSREWQRALAAVSALPAHAAWLVDGQGVCPAAGDPYLVANSVTQRLLAEQSPRLGAAAVTAGVFDVHRTAYEAVPPPFRPEARGLLEILCERAAHLAVVSNSEPHTVARLLDGLAFRGRERVMLRGGANKFQVGASTSTDPRFESLPVTVELPGLHRPIYLRRGRYFDVLRAIWDGTRTDPESTLVAGDVFELDLGMPAALGAHVQLVTRASTLPHESVLATSLARGAADSRPEAILERLGV